MRDVLKKVLQKYINHLELRKTSTESIKAILGENHFTKICLIIHIFTEMISFAFAYSPAVILLFFSFLDTSEWLLPTITVIFLLFWTFFGKTLQ